MKILIATGLFPPDIGGPATYSSLLLRELPKRGIETSVLAFGAVRHLPKLLRHFAYFLKVLRDGRSADCIYAQDPVSVGLPASVAAKILRKPFLLKIVGDYAWEQGVQRFGVKDELDEFVGKKAYSIPVRILKYIETKVALSADRIVVPSKYLQKIVHAWGIPKSRITIIYNAFDGLKDVKPYKEARAALGIEKEKIITSVARLVPWKGFSALVEMFPKILHHFPDARLYIIGEGPQWGALEALIKKHELSGRVVLTGKLPQAVVHHYISASDVFALNTSYEGFSHLLLEVMAIGTPIVTTDVGGNPELIEDGKNGMLVPLGKDGQFASAVVRYLQSTEEAKAAVHAGKKTLENFSEERMLSELLTLLQKYNV